MIVLDTPGLLEPRYELHRSMRATSLRALEDADVIAYLCDAREGVPPPLRDAAELQRDPRAPILTVLNKIDTVSPEARDALRRNVTTAIQLSALTGEGVDTLVREVTPHLPESPFLYPDDEIGTQSVRFFASELVRETALEQLDDEVPYSVACGIEEFREDRSPVYIRAVIYVERESQKGILVGHKGARIRELGRASRLKIERLVEKPVFLDLWVKVLPNWRRNVQSLRRLGYALPQEGGR
jgi:GTP-binding protein Era